MEVGEDQNGPFDADVSPNEEKNHLPRIGIIYDKTLFKEASKVPVVSERAEMVHSLIEAYGLLKRMVVIPCCSATDWDLISCHSSDFIEYMKSINNKYTEDDEAELEYGLGYDCPPFEGLYDYICVIAGSSLTAARALIDGDVEIAINWCGGWHHAQREQVSGFCYTNDIVLAIIEMKRIFTLILYVDLDSHHGDGVENTFSYSRSVFTLSFHLHESGYYPGTGALTDTGYGGGKYYCVNVPLKEGITDSTYLSVFERVFDAVLCNFKPDAVVVQCGADGLSGDPLGGLNLTPVGLGFCVKKILSLKKPTLILGGGGYNLPNTARCWTYLTSIVTGCELPNDIPEHEFFTEYGPTFELTLTPGLRKDLNDSNDIENTIKYIERNCKEINPGSSSEAKKNLN